MNGGRIEATNGGLATLLPANISLSVVMTDIINCGALMKLTRNGVVADDDLVTGFSKNEVLPFIAAIAEQIAKR
jgi:hypothetical protein